jgi:hypothetical protein
MIECLLIGYTSSKQVVFATVEMAAMFTRQRKGKVNISIQPLPFRKNAQGQQNLWQPRLTEIIGRKLRTSEPARLTDSDSSICYVLAFSNAHTLGEIFGPNG